MSSTPCKLLISTGALFVLTGFMLSAPARHGSSWDVSEKIRAWQYETGMKQAFAIMADYGDLLEQGEATEQDWRSCLRTEAQARKFIKEVLESQSPLKLPVAMAAHHELKDMNPCPAPDMFERLGARAFLSKHAL